MPSCGGASHERLQAASLPSRKLKALAQCSSTIHSGQPLSHRRPRAATRCLPRSITSRQASGAPSCDSASTSHSSVSQPSDRPPAAAAAPWTIGCGDLVTLAAIVKDRGLICVERRHAPQAEDAGGAAPCAADGLFFIAGGFSAAKVCHAEAACDDACLRARASPRDLRRRLPSGARWLHPAARAPAFAAQIVRVAPCWTGLLQR